MHKGKLHLRFGTSPSLAQRKATSEALKSYYLNHKHHSLGKKGILSSQYGIGGKAIEMFSSDGQYKIFPSLNSARQFFHVRFYTISKNVDTGKPVIIKGIEWIIKSKKDT